MDELDLRYNLKNILKEKGMSQVDLAMKIGIAANNLNTRLSRGRNVQLSLLEKICKVLDINLDQLVFGNVADGLPQRSFETSATTEESDIMLYRDKYILSLEDSQKTNAENRLLRLENEELRELLKKAPSQRKKLFNGV